MDAKHEARLVREATGLTFTCSECEKYWANQLRYWKGLGDELSYITLSCPTCTRPQLKR